VSLEPFENFDRCGLGLEIPGTEEEMLRGTSYEVYEWWKSPKLEASMEVAQNMVDADGENLCSPGRADSTYETPALLVLTQTHEDSRLGFSMLGIPRLEEDENEEEELRPYSSSSGGTQRRHFEKLEVPQEEHGRSSRLVSTPTSALDLSPDQSAGKRSPEGSSNNLATSASTPQDKPFFHEWPCGFPNCGRSFSRQHLLK
jgi:hypothetical protein